MNIAHIHKLPVSPISTDSVNWIGFPPIRSCAGWECARKPCPKKRRRGRFRIAFVCKAPSFRGRFSQATLNPLCSKFAVWQASLVLVCILRDFGFRMNGFPSLDLSFCSKKHRAGPTLKLGLTRAAQRAQKAPALRRVSSTFSFFSALLHA